MTEDTKPKGAELPEIVLTEIQGEPRARDLDIAKRLGFARPRTIRQLIERNIGELTTYGPCCTVQRLVQSNPVTEYWLSEEQALLLATCRMSSVQLRADPPA